MISGGYGDTQAHRHSPGTAFDCTHLLWLLRSNLSASMVIALVALVDAIISYCFCAVVFVLGSIYLV